MSKKPPIDDRIEQRSYERHEFEPFHPSWAKPRCKVCREFEDHPLHRPNECRKRGPYLPVGDTEWECETHDVELVRIAGRWGTPAKREEMACPVAEADQISSRLS